MTENPHTLIRDLVDFAENSGHAEETCFEAGGCTCGLSSLIARAKALREAQTADIESDAPLSPGEFLNAAKPLFRELDRYGAGSFCVSITYGKTPKALVICAVDERAQKLRALYDKLDKDEAKGAK